MHNRSIWFSHISTLNDPSELQYGKNLVISKLSEKIDKEKDNNIEMLLRGLAMEIEVFGLGSFHTYVACFCESDNLLSQWRSYASKGGGYNLGLCFNSDTKYSHNLENPSDDSYIILRKIIYDPKDQEEVISRYISSIVSASKNAISCFTKSGGIPDAWAPRAVIESVNILLDIVLSLKNPVFMEEKEWRLIKLMQGNHRPNLLKFIENNDRHIPYLDTIIYDCDDLQENMEFPLRAIRFGPMLDEISTRAVLELLVNNKSAEPNKINIDVNKISIEGAGYVIR